MAPTEQILSQLRYAYREIGIVRSRSGYDAYKSIDQSKLKLRFFHDEIIVKNIKIYYSSLQFLACYLFVYFDIYFMENNK